MKFQKYSISSPNLYGNTLFSPYWFRHKVIFKNFHTQTLTLINVINYTLDWACVFVTHVIVLMVSHYVSLIITRPYIHDHLLSCHVSSSDLNKPAIIQSHINLYTIESKTVLQFLVRIYVVILYFRLMVQELRHF